MDDAGHGRAPNAPQAGSSDASGPRLPTTPERFMNTAASTPTRPLPLPPQMHAHYELRFASLFNPGRALAFPCDAGGRVEMDALSETALRNYLYARAVVGREFATPAVVLS
jgi:hypothetical protein